MGDAGPLFRGFGGVAPKPIVLRVWLIYGPEKRAHFVPRLDAARATPGLDLSLQYAAEAAVPFRLKGGARCFPRARDPCLPCNRSPLLIASGRSIRFPTEFRGPPDHAPRRTGPARLMLMARPET